LFVFFFDSTLKIHLFLHKFLNLFPVLSRENRNELFPNFALGMTREEAASPHPALADEVVV
jgi:hypothetical protein